MKKVLLASLLGACVIGLYTYAMGQPKDGPRAEANADILYKEPIHIFYFNYQAYLTQSGKKGETAETWRVLPIPERFAKVKEGETLLEKIHAELMAKRDRTPEDNALLQAVWGKNDGTAIGNTPQHRSVVAGEKSRSVEQVNVVSKNLEGIQKKNDWNKLFDGNQNSAKSEGMDGSVAGNANLGGVKPALSPKTQIMRPLDLATIPPAGNSDNRPVKKSFPLAAGGLLLGVGAALGVRKILGARNAELASSESDGPRAEKSSSKTKLVRQAAFDHNAIAGIFGVVGEAATSCTCTGSSSEGCNCSGTTAKRACNCANDSSTFCDCSGGSSVVCDCNSSSSKLCTCSSGSSTTCDCSGSSAKVDVPCNCSSSSTK